MDGGGVAEARRRSNVVGWEPGGELAAVVADIQSAVSANLRDGPSIAILDPVGGGESDAAVVVAGDDDVADAGPVSTWFRISDAVLTGAAVEFGDEVAGGCEHDRVQAGIPVGNPSSERILDCYGKVTDVNAAMIKIEGE